jgi:hypothetical protein
MCCIRHNLTQFVWARDARATTANHYGIALRRARGTVCVNLVFSAKIANLPVAAPPPPTTYISPAKPPNLAHISCQLHFYNPVVALYQTVLTSLDLKPF